MQDARAASQHITHPDHGAVQGSGYFKLFRQHFNKVNLFNTFCNYLKVTLSNMCACQSCLKPYDFLWRIVTFCFGET
tara:strand:- start:98 stop:328 length:231 start_codon:yes stop_codon:yes gene_type:complete